MPAPSAGPPRCRHWLRRFGRVLVLVTQLVALVVPLAEAHEERALSAHVEAPRTVPHPGDHPDVCPACRLLSVQGCPAAPSLLEESERAQRTVPRWAVGHVVTIARSFSNASRAPPLCS